MQLLKEYYISMINRTTDMLSVLIELLKELYIKVEFLTHPQGGYIRPNSSLVIKDFATWIRKSLHPI